MVKCINPECGNYNQELDETLETCPACGKETENKETSFDFRRRFAPAICVVSFVSILFALLPYWTTFSVGIGLIIACIVASVIIRIKAAIICSITAAALFFGILLYYGFFSVLF